MSEINEFDTDFKKMREVSRTNETKMASLAKVLERRRKRKFNVLPMIVSGAAVIIALVLFMTINDSAPFENAETITDGHTIQDIPFIETIEPHMFALDYGLDTMDWGNHDYNAHAIVIDPNAYVRKGVKRGDVVLFESERGQTTVSRIVALPGEKIHIINDQIYIDNKRLDAFYGKAHRIGMDRAEYNEAVKETGNSLTTLFEEDMEVVLLSKGEYFVAGDDWLRSIREVIKDKDIVGKVLGYGGRK